MDFLEKDLENIIWESSDDQLNKANLYFNGKRFRQLKIGNYGVSDLITVEKTWILGDKDKNIIDNFLSITIYELKNKKVGISAFLQAVNYARGIKSYIKQRTSIKFEIRIVLIGRDIDKSGSFIYLTDLVNSYHPDSEETHNSGFITSIDFYEYHYKIDGIKFQKVSDYKLIQEGFNL